MPSVLFSETQGGDWEWQIQCLLDESDVAVTGLSVASEIKFEIKRFSGDELASALGSVNVVDDTEGIVMITVPSSESAKLGPGYWWGQVLFIVDDLRRYTNKFGIQVNGSLITPTP
jgi:hypothetical protein